MKKYLWSYWPMPASVALVSIEIALWYWQWPSQYAAFFTGLTLGFAVWTFYSGFMLIKSQKQIEALEIEYRRLVKLSEL